MSNTSDQIQALRDQIKTLEAQESEERKAAQQSVTPVYTYSLTLDDQGRRFEKIMDESVLVYKLTGVCENKAECDAVGRIVNDGSMSYFFNTASGRFICGTGGGRIFVQDGSSFSVDRREHDDHAQVWHELAQFVAKSPEGGDITGIVEGHHQRAKSGAPKV